MQVFKYYQNEDLVDLKYKSFFDKNAHSNYPSFSICKATYEPTQYNESQLPENIRSSDLFQMFTGNLQDDEKNRYKSNALHQFLDNFSSNEIMSYDDLLNEEVKNVLSGYMMDSFVPEEDDIQDSTQGYVRKWVHAEGHTYFPKTLEGLNVDSLAYRCWTRRVILTPGQTIHSENVILKTGALSRGDFFEGYVSLHYENQLIRSINTMIGISKSMLLESDVNKLPTFIITVTHIKIIKSRSDASKKCNPELKNDDEKFLRTLIKMLGCIPVFWKDQTRDMFHSSNITFCTKEDPYQRFWDHFNSRQNNVVYGKFSPSCYKVSLTYDMSTKDDYPEIRKFFNGDLLINIY